MAGKRNTTGLKPWKPGESGNPGGRPKAPDWLPDQKRLPNHTAAVLWSKWLSMEAEQLKKESENWKLPALELSLCRAILRDIETGDLRNVEIGLSRILGKVKDAPEGSTGDDLGSLNPEDLLKRVRTAIGVLEATKQKDGSFKVED